MNQSAVALAADSAATMSGTKIFAANKIFALSKFEPVAVMIYGNASCMQVPWETIIKEFRAELGEQHYAAVSDYGEAFLEFMASNKLVFPEEQQEMFAYISAYQSFETIRDDVVNTAKREAAEKGGIDEADGRRIVSDVIESHHEKSKVKKNRAGLPRGFRQKLRSTYGEYISAAIKEIFENLDLNQKLRGALVEMVLNTWCKEGRRGASGVVFAGFGREQIFPSVKSYEVDGVLLDQPILWERNHGKISYAHEAQILGFAQADMIHLFIEGVTPQYEEFVEGYFEEIINGLDSVVSSALPANQMTPKLKKALKDRQAELLSKLGDELSDHRQSIYINPVLRVVASLPKDELGELAESLVNLTSLKRRVSLDDETVGGPIDVVVISRGDGLIWTKRKHYFAPEYNHQFFTNYYRSR
jgi:hypothetical protein